MTYRIMLADDHFLLRRGVRRIIDEADNMTVVGEASDGAELLDLLKNAVPDMAIVDISMPRIGGIEATREIKRAYPAVKVLVLTMHRNKEYLYRALTAGADGYLLKEDTERELFTAIDVIRGGEIYLSPAFSAELRDDLVEVLKAGGDLESEPLSLREQEVLKLIAEGKSNKEIADVLCISIRTVEHHRASIASKLDIRNVVDLVKYAIRKGYVTEGT
jgi:DNA-binding NarL/FixJ family response regulator